MTGTGYLALVLLSMAWVAALAALFFRVWPLAGLAGSVAVFFSIPALAKYGVEVPLPWLWILLPLALLLRRR